MLQPVTRDFAFIVPEGLTADTLLRALRGSDKEAITGVRLFDRFESADGLSLAFEVTLQPGDKSFTDEQIGQISARITAAAEKVGSAPAELVRLVFEGIDRDVDPGLDLVALQTRRDDLPDLQGHGSGTMHEPAPP